MSSSINGRDEDTEFMPDSCSKVAQSRIQCPGGGFRCGNESSRCLPQSQWCDDITDCENEADESESICTKPASYLFDAFHNLTDKRKNESSIRESDCEPKESIPSGCTCGSGFMICEGITKIPEEMPPNIIKLSIMSEHIDYIPPGAFNRTTRLTSIYFQKCRFTHLEEGVFQGLPNVLLLTFKNTALQSWDRGTFLSLSALHWVVFDEGDLTLQSGAPLVFPPSVKWIFLTNNPIQVIHNSSFSEVNHVEHLSLAGNRITHIDPAAFLNMTNLMELHLNNNSLRDLDAGLFSGVPLLCVLNLSENLIRRLPQTIFSHLRKLRTLILEGLELTNINIGHFSSMTRLGRVEFKRLKYCRLVPHVIDCLPKTDGVSSVENLLGSRLIRVFIWIIATIICAGNLGVLVGRQLVHERNHSYSIIIRNLCVSDFLMGVYLFVVAAQDANYRGDYNKYALRWTSSFGCQLAGFTAMLSCEVSVFTLVVVSFERCLIISYPLRKRQMNARNTVCILVAMWLLGITIGILPIIFMEEPTAFYGSNGLCFPLHIHDPYMAGWEYSAAFFLGINFCAVASLCVVYPLMYWNIRRTRTAMDSVLDTKQEDMKIAFRLFWVIVTDLFCWIPIIIVKIFALCKWTISDEAYAWFTVFVLPINSAINPLLYSLSTDTFRANVRSRLVGHHFHRGGFLERLGKYWSGRTHTGQNSSEVTRLSIVTLGTNRPSVVADTANLTPDTESRLISSIPLTSREENGVGRELNVL